MVVSLVELAAYKKFRKLTDRWIGQARREQRKKRPHFAQRFSTPVRPRSQARPHGT